MVLFLHSGAPEPTGTPFRVFERLHLLYVRLVDVLHDELSDTVSRMEHQLVGPEVEEEDFDLPGVVPVDYPRSYEDPFATETASGSDLTVRTFRDGEPDARGEQMAFSRTQRDLFGGA